jgi:hypothetical protein
MGSVSLMGGVGETVTADLVKLYLSCDESSPDRIEVVCEVSDRAAHQLILNSG